MSTHPTILVVQRPHVNVPGTENVSPPSIVDAIARHLPCDVLPHVDGRCLFAFKGQARRLAWANDDRLSPHQLKGRLV